MTNGEQKRYRRNVAVVVLNAEGMLLACRRSDKHRAWQLPQGGIDPGESELQAMNRELLEEIGTNDVTVIDTLPNPIRYDWPSTEYHRGYHGQEQYYFLVRLGKDAVLDLNAHEPPEFDATQWMGCDEFLRHTSGFKEGAYREAIERFQRRHPDLLAK